uniref:Uncharacterized protein n=1 Tax=Oryza meridionalis TaxID=40149 RepID=A0A0E0FEA2_9ORYZ
MAMPSQELNSAAAARGRRRRQQNPPGENGRLIAAVYVGSPLRQVSNQLITPQICKKEDTPESINPPATDEKRETLVPQRIRRGHKHNHQKTKISPTQREIIHMRKEKYKAYEFQCGTNISLLIIQQEQQANRNSRNRTEAEQLCIHNTATIPITE